MGQPEYLTPKQVERLQEASEVSTEKLAVNFHDGAVFLKARVPAHAVAAITIEFK